MQPIGTQSRHRLTRRPWGAVAFVALVGFIGPEIMAVGSQAGAAAGPVSSSTGFVEPFAGTPQFEHVAPTEIANQGQLNQPLGQPLADEIAREIGLNKSDVLTQGQYRAFITGQGRDGSGNPASAEQFDQSVKILTNTVGHPLAYKDENGRVVTSVLASYGLFVTTSGELESPAYETAPTYLVNILIAPRGYMSIWMKSNFARRSLEQLYRSTYTSELAYGNAAQNQSKPAELITNTKGAMTSVVGMSMGPALWIVNFALIYTLNPALAAEMPAQWVPIPAPVVQAINNGNGQVPYSTVASYFH